MGNISSILKERRKALGLTLAQIADMTGVTEATVQRWESGNIKTLRHERIAKLADVLGVTPSSLMGWEEECPLPSNIMPMPKTYKVPRLGSIACGLPILAEQNIEDYDEVPELIKCDFTLRCKGDSMVGAGIQDGDIVYIHHQETIENGEIAAIMVGDDEATLKRFKRMGDTVVLVPENSNYDPLVFTKEELTNIRIVGKVIGYTHMF